MPVATAAQYLLGRVPIAASYTEICAHSLRPDDEHNRSLFAAMPDSSDPKYPAADTKLEDVVAEKQGILNPDDSAQEAGDKMRSRDVDALPVSEGRRLVGVVDHAHSALSAAGRGHDPQTLTVREAMNRILVYCREDDDCATALRRMAEHHLHHIPVVDPQLRIIGMVHREDLEPSSKGAVSRRDWR